MAAELGIASTGADSTAKTLESFESWLRSIPAARGIPLGRGYQASTELFQSPAGDFAVKTARGPWPWRCLGEAALRREYAVYRRISGIPGVPRCLGLVDGKMLVLEYVSGGTFRSREREIQDWDRFFVQLLETIRGIHSAGVAHGDLKRKDNLLVGPGEQPFIVDFGVASIEKSSRAPWVNLVYRWMRQYDYNAWVKLKYRGQLAELAPADAALYRPTATERIARVIRVIWQKLTLRRLRRRIWPRR
jgi:predicted Ser/Thr protein kinase